VGPAGATPCTRGEGPPPVSARPMGARWGKRCAGRASPPVSPHEAAGGRGQSPSSLPAHRAGTASGPPGASTPGPTASRPPAPVRRARPVARPSKARATPAARTPRAPPRTRASPDAPLSSAAGRSTTALSSGAPPAPRARCGWRRRCRGATRRPPPTTGRGLAARSFPHPPGAAGPCPAPVTGKPRLRVREAVTPHRQSKGQGEAHPCARAWAPDLQHRERPLAPPTAAALRATILRPQHGQGAVGRPGRQSEADRARPPREGPPQPHPPTNLGR
jgi:hypothetical protein